MSKRLSSPDPAICREKFDSILCTQDGGKFFVHSHVLANCSPYFEAIYRTKIHFKEWRDFVIPGVTAKGLQLSIDHAYQREIPISWDNVVDLLRAATQFKMLILTCKCCEFLSFELAPFNCVWIIRFAGRLRCQEMEEKARNFLLLNLENVMHHCPWLLNQPLTELLAVCGVNDPTTLYVHNVNKTHWSKVPDPSVFRVRYSCVLQDNSIFVIGGLVGETCLSSCRCLDLTSGIWRQMAALRQRRHSASAVQMEGQIYVLGGNGVKGCLRTAEIYNAEKNKWFPIAPMNFPRQGARVSSSNGNIYVVGGYSMSSFVNSTEYYSKVSNQWTVVVPAMFRRPDVGRSLLRGHVFLPASSRKLARPFGDAEENADGSKLKVERRATRWQNHTVDVRRLPLPKPRSGSRLYNPKRCAIK